MGLSQEGGQTKQGLGGGGRGTQGKERSTERKSQGSGPRRCGRELAGSEQEEIPGEKTSMDKAEGLGMPHTDQAQYVNSAGARSDPKGAAGNEGWGSQQEPS